MESSDSSRRHRRRGRHTKKRQHCSIDNLRPGRAPVGLPNSMNTTHLETESEESDQEPPPQLMVSSIQARLHRLLNSTKIQEQEPDSEIRPLLTKDMSGLGAQARAAEYAAATAARARQVSRDAEDQKLPPKAAPVSLSALAKAQPTSRNKGPKAWKPLNLDEINESSDDASTGKEIGRGTPIISAPVLIEWTSSCTNRQISASSTREESIKVNIPIAPRAMMTSNVPATVTADPSPQRKQTDPVVKIPVRQGTQDVYLSSIPFSLGGFPCLAVPPQFYSRHPNFIGTPSSHEAANFQKFGCMMVPSDLSPTKQQQKFAMMGQMQNAFYRDDPAETPEHPLPHQILSHQSPSYYETLKIINTTTAGDTYGWNASVQDGTYVDYTVNDTPFQENRDVGYGGDGEEEVDQGFYNGTAAPGYPMVQVPYGMTSVSYSFNEGSAPTSHHAHATASPANVYQCRQTSLIPSSDSKRQTHPATLEHEEPYDRKSKMQRFVAEATHEALARKGKTVLHNPDLYKEKEPRQQKAGCPGNVTDPSLTSNHTDNRLPEDENHDKKRYRPVPWAVRSRLPDGTWQVMLPPVEQGQQPKLNLPPLSKDELRIIANAIDSSTSGPEQQPESCTTVRNDPINGELPDKRLNPIDRVGSEEWSKFRPVTSVERERVRACMSRAAADLAPNIPRPGLFDDKDSSNRWEDDLKNSQEWYHRDFRGEQAFRAQLPTIAEKHAALRKAAARHANGGVIPKGFKLGVDDGVAANIIMGEVIANLASYVVGDRKSAEQRRNFHKVKSVPEFATDKGGVSGGSGLSDSYFDGDETGFQGAPVRIARDPRFRPQGKEGLKLKPEEEWKNRHEMYGRRVL